MHEYKVTLTNGDAYVYADRYELAGQPNDGEYVFYENGKPVMRYPVESVWDIEIDPQE